MSVEFAASARAMELRVQGTTAAVVGFHERLSVVEQHVLVLERRQEG